MVHELMEELSKQDPDLEVQMVGDNESGTHYEDASTVIGAKTAALLTP